MDVKQLIVLAICLLASTTLAQTDPCPGLSCYGCLNKKDDLGFRQPVCDFCLVNGTCHSKSISGSIVCARPDDSAAWAESTSDCGSLSASELRIIIIVGSIVGGILAIGGCYYYWNSKKKEEKRLKLYKEERREQRDKNNVNVEIQAQMRRATIEHHRNASRGGGEHKADHAPVIADWNCSACTFKNDGPAQKCKMCGTAKSKGGDGDQPKHARNGSVSQNQNQNGGHARKPSQSQANGANGSNARRTSASQPSGNNNAQKPASQLPPVPEGIVFIPEGQPAVAASQPKPSQSQPQSQPQPRAEGEPAAPGEFVFVPV